MESGEGAIDGKLGAGRVQARNLGEVTPEEMMGTVEANRVREWRGSDLNCFQDGEPHLGPGAIFWVVCHRLAVCVPCRFHLVKVTSPEEGDCTGNICQHSFRRVRDIQMRGSSWS